MWELLLLSSVAAIAIPAGAALAVAETIRPRWHEEELRHSVIAFGGGILLSAVAFVLVPEGTAALPWWAASVFFLAGGVGFMLIDRAVESLGGSASQLVAMLADFVPEAIALGAACAVGRPTALLLALMITLQNLPEGFNAYRELRSTARVGRWRVIGLFLLLVPLGPAAGLAGFTLLAEADAVVGALMLFAGGGILYLTFEDVAPQARLEHKRSPALGAVAGFLLGLVAHMLIDGGG